MFLGALLDLGLPRRQLEDDLAGLALPHHLIVRRVNRGALAARYVDVRVGSRSRPKTRRRASTHEHGRTYREIVRVLTRARLLLDPAFTDLRLIQDSRTLADGP